MWFAYLEPSCQFEKHAFLRKYINKGYFLVWLVGHRRIYVNSRCIDQTNGGKFLFKQAGIQLATTKANIDNVLQAVYMEQLFGIYVALLFECFSLYTLLFEMIALKLPNSKDK